MKLHPALFISGIIFPVLILSCSPKNNSNDAESLVNMISRNASDPDSMKAVRDLISQSGNEELRNELLHTVSDSSDILKSSVLVVTLLPEEVADYLIDNPSRILADNLRRAYTLINDGKGLQGFTLSMIEKFDKMPISHKAAFVTSMGSPEECALAIENGDSLLVEEIRNIYSDSTELLNRFNNALRSNISTPVK